MDANEQRARFEAWANDYDPLSNPQFHYGAGYIGQVRNRYRPISYADADLLWQAWRAALAQQVPADGEWAEEVARKLDDGAPGILYRQDLATILRATTQAPQPVVDGYRHSTHHVHRGPDSLPCYCTATVDHAIGQEQNAEAEALARRFHEAYERLAPSFGYETRTETRQFDPATPNGRLMIAVCASLTQPQQGAAEPIGWVFQHDETGRQTFCPNDGVNTVVTFLELNPRYALVCPAYTTIGQQAVDDAVHEALTLLEQATCHDGRYGQMERIGWQESAQKLLPRLRAALAAHGKPNS